MGHGHAMATACNPPHATATFVVRAAWSRYIVVDVLLEQPGQRRRQQRLRGEVREADLGAPG